MIWHPQAHIAIREARGLSRRDEAHRAAVAPSYLSRLEANGGRSPSLDIVSSLAAVLDVDPRALYIDPTTEQLVAELIARFNGTQDRLTIAIDILQQIRAAS